jgi:hypothetical protein
VDEGQQPGGSILIAASPLDEQGSDRLHRSRGIQPAALTVSPDLWTRASDMDKPPS